MIYDLCIFLFVLGAAPKLLWQKWRRGKKMQSLKERLGFDPPTGERGIWIHAVSVGEVKAAAPLVNALRSNTSTLLVTTSTIAGMEEAKRSLKQADHLRYLPLDFSWIMRRWMRAFRPKLLLFVEGDLWPNLLKEAKRLGVNTAAISAKISERSAGRLKWLGHLRRALYGSLDLLAAQNEDYQRRFQTLLGQDVPISGNIKLDANPEPVDAEATQRRFGLSKAIAIASTHEPEEQELLSELAPLLKEGWVVFLAPRHPERFEEVAKLLEKMGLSFCRWKEQRVNESIVLVDTMGQLPSCYAASRLAIVAGSFSSKVGGHNVFEPCLYGCPVLFGPHVDTQLELTSLVTRGGVGRQVTSKTLLAAVREWIDNDHLQQQSLLVAATCRGSLARTMLLLEPLLSSEDLQRGKRSVKIVLSAK